MKEFFEQWMKTVEQMGAPWRQMAAGPPFGHQARGFQPKWGSWFAAMRSTYEINSSWWKTLNDQTEEVFFKIFSESPAYNEAMENQLREFWDNIKKAQQLQHDTIIEQLEKMEKLLKEQEL